MELMVSAASSGQMLTGKVAGVGAAGLTQYAVIVAAGLLATQVQGPILDAVLGPDGSAAGGGGGLTLPILGTFLVFFLLGFLLYAFLYAAAGSLVSRQEDIQMIAGPMLGLSIVGYFAASIAITSIDAPWVAPLSYVPFFSPWLMVARVTLSHVDAWEVSLAIGLLLGAIGLSLAVAARVYRAGVLLYGQRPSLGALVRVALRGE
jgi:ABC-2 type transport system permease protein